LHPAGSPRGGTVGALRLAENTTLHELVQQWGRVDRQQPRHRSTPVGHDDLLAGPGPLDDPKTDHDRAVPLGSRTMRVAVTGGGGFIGSHIVERMLGDGHDVVVLDNFATGRRENLTPLVNDIELVEGDIRSYERVQTAVRGCDVVLHQAGLPSVPRSIQDPLTSTEANITGTLNVLLNARDAGVRRVVYASSSSIYGAERGFPMHEEMRPQPMAPYSVSKLAGEGFCRTFSSIYGLETVALRYFNAFGPRQDPLSQYSAVIPAFITTCLNGARPVIFGDGEQSRDFTYVENVVEANVRAMKASGVSGDVYNIACGERITLNALLATIKELTGADDLEPIYESTRPGDVRHSVADISKAAADFGYRPVVELREGLRRTVDDLAVATPRATVA
jgi:nucleoside-diphosphate-sugar epimerase